MIPNPDCGPGGRPDEHRRAHQIWVGHVKIHQYARRAFRHKPRKDIEEDLNKLGRELESLNREVPGSVDRCEAALVSRTKDECEEWKWVAALINSYIPGKLPRQPHLPLNDQLLVSPAEDPSQESDQKFQEARLRRHFKQALLAMSQEERQVLKLLRKGKTPAEIAAILDRPRSTIYDQAQRAKGKLARQLRLHAT